MTETAIPKTRTYQGSCHCGAVAFDVEMALDGVMDCNCSYCGRTGNILGFVTPEAFALRTGEDAQAEYRFNTNKIEHLFCRVCGVTSFGRGVAPNGQTMVAVNVRCLEGVDVGSLNPQHVDGRSF